MTNLSEVTGKRIDPKGYDIKTKLLKSSIDNIDLKKFIALPLKSFIIQSIAGNWGIDENEEVEENEEYQKCLVIRATEFDNQYNLNLDNSRVKYRLIKKSILSKIDLKENDLLIENIVDDDQGVYIKTYFENKKMFKLNYLGKGEWFSLFKKYDKTSKMQKIRRLVGLK